MRHTAFCKYQSKDMLLLGLVVFGCVVLACVCTADLECQYCEPNTYCFVDNKELCPAHSSSPALRRRVRKVSTNSESVPKIPFKNRVEYRFL